MLELLKITLVLAVMVIIVAKKIDLIYAILAGIIATGLLFNRGLSIFLDFYITLTDLEVLNILAMFFFVYYLANLLTETGLLRSMLKSLERLIRDVRLVIISLPFMIGFVPAPSGAMLSAPFVEEVGNTINLKPERKLIINYWFRHITEYLNPIYPGPILTVTILGITFKTLFFLNLPIMLFVFILGFFMFVFRLKGKKTAIEQPTHKDIRTVVNGIWPILLAIILPIVTKINLNLSLITAIILIAIVNKIKVNKLKAIIKKSIKIDILVLIFLVMFFKTVLENSRAIKLVSDSFISYNFPPIILVIAIPMLIGALTGMTVGYVGLAFPLLLPFLKPANADLSLVLLAYASGYIGLLLSPAHLCFSVTQKYFKAGYAKVYKLLVPAIIILFLFALFLTLVGWPFFI